MKLYIYVKLAKVELAFVSTRKILWRERHIYLYMHMYIYAHQSTTLWFPLCACEGQAFLLPASLALSLVLDKQTD